MKRYQELGTACNVLLRHVYTKIVRYPYTKQSGSVDTFLSYTHLLHDEQLVHADGEKDLKGAQRRDLGERREPVGHVLERDVVLEGQHTREPDVLLCEVTCHREHSNAAVLDLHVAEAVEPLLVRVLHEAERVPKADRGLRADLGLEAHLHGGVRGLG